MAAWLLPRLPDGTRIVASPARRTRQTAAALGQPVETLAALAPGASAEALLAGCGWDPLAPGCVLAVGHQPTLGEVASRLLGMRGAASVRKGAIWWLSGREREGSPVVLTACLPPALLPG